MSSINFHDLSVAEEPSFLQQTKDNISSFFGDAQDFAQLVGAFLEFIGGFLDYLGLFGFFLFIITMALLSITNAVSPLSKLANYLMVCGFVSVFYLLNAPASSAVMTILRYLSVMAAPLVLTYGVQHLISFVRGLLGMDSVQGRFIRIRDLAEEIIHQSR